MGDVTQLFPPVRQELQIRQAATCRRCGGALDPVDHVDVVPQEVTRSLLRCVECATSWLLTVTLMVDRTSDPDYTAT